ncbi:MAG: CPBP family intramembrane metalloprotease [Verrucomicrobia bacterium]|nr:CPBP family intramembrane metalloprotease [Verrucomicrobiota bacterium]
MTVATSVALLKKDEVGAFTSSDLLLGAAGSTVSLSLGYGAMRGTKIFLEKWGVSELQSQSYFHIYDWIGTLSNSLLRGILKSIAVVYIILLVPIVEEWFFRDVMYSWQEGSSLNSDHFSSRVFRVLSNGLIFGAFHFSLLLGWSNVLIVVVSTIAGLVFSLLRELTGDQWSSTVAHSLNNSFVLFINVLRI